MKKYVLYIVGITVFMGILTVLAHGYFYPTVEPNEAIKFDGVTFENRTNRQMVLDRTALLKTMSMGQLPGTILFSQELTESGRLFRVVDTSTVEVNADPHLGSQTIYYLALLSRKLENGDWRSVDGYDNLQWFVDAIGYACKGSGYDYLQYSQAANFSDLMMTEWSYAYMQKLDLPINK